MKTNVTQFHFMAVMAEFLNGKNPSLYKNSYDKFQVRIGGHDIEMQPNNPMDAILAEWKEFVDKLNELVITEESEANEHLQNSLLYTLIPDHIYGSTYRVILEAEYDFLVTDNKPNWWDWNNQQYPYNRKYFDDRIWHYENRNGVNGTHPVGIKTANDFGLDGMLGGLV